ncbi:MAG: hypothetical protein LLF95_00900, partial [Bacteroidales bacterium]|nr:hypothetical protein [Bacteroidales bacterium]
LEVFSAYNNTENYSWAVLSGSNNMASLNINIPVSDTYYVRVRAYRQTAGAGGVVNLNVNGQYYFADTPVAGNGFAYYHTPQEVLNYFTTHNTGDPRIWIESSNGFPGTICAFNDDYGSHGGDWSWGLNSRIKKQIGQTVSAVLLSTYGSYNPTTTCDLYIGCKQSTINYDFPNLKIDDAIISGTSDGGSNPLANMNYNCASWGGGRIDLGRYFWASDSPDPLNLSSPWYVSGDFWLSWDKFFGNNPERYAGAVTYTRIGADATNGEVAMWYNNTDQVYTHFSVKKPANNQPHGYDWESKPGGYIRIFHPRDALNDEATYAYGHIQLYFKRVASSKAVYSLQESIDLGLTVLPMVNLTENEQSIVNGLKSAISENVSTEFSKEFEQLIKKANSSELMLYSNPIYLLQSDEYKNILSLCEKYNKSIRALLVEHIFSENSLNAELAEMLFNTITEKEYGYLMSEVKNEWTNNCYDKNGAYIAPSPINNTKNYIKKILVNIEIPPKSSANSQTLLTSEEQIKINLLNQAIPENIKTEFEDLFINLTEKINSPEFINISNPTYLYATEEYKSLLNFCVTEKQQNVWSMLIENIFDEQKPLIAELSSMIFINVTADKYGYLMDEVKSEWAQNCYDQDGNYINPSPQQNTRNYVKKVLATLGVGELKMKTGLNSLENNNTTFRIYPTVVSKNANLEINLDKPYSASLRIHNVNGSLLQTVFSNQLLLAGNNKVNWNVPDNISSGIVMFSLTINNQIFNRRILVK